MFLSARAKSRTTGKRKTTRKNASRKRSSAAKGRGGAARSRSAQRQWKKKGRQRSGRLSSLSAFLPILERREDKQHVVSFDPEEQEARGTPIRRASRRSSRGRQAPQGRGRRTVREAEEDLEEVRTTSRRRALKGAPMQEEADKIQIEVGAVKALSTKYGIVRGMTWMVVLSMLLWWVPILGPATVGYVGGRKSGGPFRAAVAALIPLLFVFGVVALTTSSAENVPLTVKHYVTAGYGAVVAGLPFDFPLLSYVFSNLGAVMTSGPDVLFTVLAFALVGGAVTQMRIHERSVPPITARLPKHRMVQGPARSYENANEAMETLVARFAALVERAERRGVSGDPADGRSVQRRGWRGGLSARSERVPEEYPDLKASSKRDPVPDSVVLDSPTRQVVSSVLASTAPQAKGRAAKAAVRAARPVDLGIPGSIALADAPSADHSVAPLGSAHVYRPSKLYHIYGGTVNPVARKKLEKRLRRTHTLHSMRQGARALVKQPDALPRSERGRLSELDDLVAEDSEKPRSLESAAIGSDLHYDALEHLENASVRAAADPVPKKPKPKAPKPTGSSDEDDLGGLIAHLGEGGEAVVDTGAVSELEFGNGPTFDRRGRQRARIASDGLPTREEPPARAAVDTAAEERRKAEKKADAAREKARVDRWLEHTLSEIPGTSAPKKAPRSLEAAEVSPKTAPKAEASTEEVAPKKKRESPSRATPARFEVTHGSVEADAEAEGSDSEAAAPSKRSRTAAQILKEIRQQKKDDISRREQAEAARRARDAKAAADEIERRVRDNEDASSVPLSSDSEPHPSGATDGDEGAAVLTAGGKAVALQAAPKARRHRSEDLEAVLTTAEELSGELEMTLDPIREEEPTEREAHAALASIQMVDPEEGPAAAGEPPADDPPAAQMATGAAAATGAPPSGVAPEGRADSGVDSGADADSDEDVERDVSPEDVVLAGPSTDTPGFDPEEAELSDNDREKIKKRLQEGWNRL